MKLPEYRDDKPLYSSDDSSWDDIKFPIMMIVWPILLVVAAGAVLYGAFGIIRSLFHALLH